MCKTSVPLINVLFWNNMGCLNTKMHTLHFYQCELHVNILHLNKEVMFGLLRQRQSDLMCSFLGGECPLQVKQHNTPPSLPPSIYSSVFNMIREQPSSLNYPFFSFPAASSFSS